MWLAEFRAIALPRYGRIAQSELKAHKHLELQAHIHLIEELDEIEEKAFKHFGVDPKETAYSTLNFYMKQAEQEANKSMLAEPKPSNESYVDPYETDDLIRSLVISQTEGFRAKAIMTDSDKEHTVEAATLPGLMQKLRASLIGASEKA